MTILSIALNRLVLKLLLAKLLNHLSGYLTLARAQKSRLFLSEPLFSWMNMLLLPTDNRSPPDHGRELDAQLLYPGDNWCVSAVLLTGLVRIAHPSPLREDYRVREVISQLQAELSLSLVQDISKRLRRKPARLFWTGGTVTTTMDSNFGSAGGHNNLRSGRVPDRPTKAAGCVDMMFWTAMRHIGNL